MVSTYYSGCLPVSTRGSARLNRTLFRQKNVIVIFSLLFAGSSSQVCRPHFHSALHPWDASKSLVPHAHSTGWIPFSAAPGKGSLSHPSPSPLGHSSGPTTSSSNPFNFPPTPPKDSTPDVSGGGSGSGNATGNGAGAPNGAGGAPGTTSSASDYSPAGEQQKEGSLNGDTSGGYSSPPGGMYFKKVGGDGLSENPYSTSGLTSYSSSVYSYPTSALYSGSKSPATIKAENHGASHHTHASLGGDSSALNHYSSALSSYSTSLGSTMGGATAHPMATYPYMAAGADYTSSALFHPANMLKAASLARCRTKTRLSSGEGERTFAY